MDLMDTLKDWAWLITVVILPIAVNAFRLSASVKRMEKLLDADKIAEFNGEYAVLKSHVQDMKDDTIPGLKQDVRNIFQKLEDLRK